MFAAFHVYSWSMSRRPLWRSRLVIQAQKASASASGIITQLRIFFSGVTNGTTPNSAARRVASKNARNRVTSTGKSAMWRSLRKVNHWP